MLGGIFSGRDLTRPEAAELLGYVFDGQATDAQIAGVLVALAKKGECVDEIVGLTEAMRARMVVLRTRHQCFVDTAGTGASRAKAFNISTAAAIVAAAAGVPVAAATGTPAAIAGKKQNAKARCPRYSPGETPAIRERR